MFLGTTCPPSGVATADRTIWQNRTFRGCLAGRPYPRATCETQLSPSILTLSIPVMCRAHASFRGMISHDIPAKTRQSSIAWVFTHSLSHTQPLQINSTINIEYKRLNKITIKFGTELKPTKHIVVNYNFTLYSFNSYNFNCCMHTLFNDIYNYLLIWLYHNLICITF